MMNLQFNIRVLINEEVREIEHEQEQRRLCTTLRLHRVLGRQRSVFSLPDNEFRYSYRVNKATLLQIVEVLTPFMKMNRRSDGISIETKVRHIFYFNKPIIVKHLYFYYFIL